MRSDSELYRAFLSGDKKAYDELMVRYGDAVTRYLTGYVHIPEDAEDLMIDAFAAIMFKKPQIGEGCFKAYLYRAARNLATRFHLTKKRTDVFSLEEISEEPAAPTGFEAELIRSERIGTVRKCMDRLERELREALYLVYFERMSYAEAAEVMKVNPKRVDRLLQRAKQSLKEELAKEGITDIKEF